MIIIFIYSRDSHLLVMEAIRMSKILIVYASQTGNTEIMAEVMADYFDQLNHDVDLRTFDFDYVEPDELLEYDGILIGTHTWDAGSMPYEVEDFYEDVEEVDITQKPFGVFGSGDSFYDIFGGAVDLIADRLEELGGDVLPDRLKTDLEPDKEDIELCQQFAELMLQKIGKNMSQSTH